MDFSVARPYSGAAARPYSGTVAEPYSDTVAEPYSGTVAEPYSSRVARSYSSKLAVDGGDDDVLGDSRESMIHNRENSIARLEKLLSRVSTSYRNSTVIHQNL